MLPCRWKNYTSLVFVPDACSPDNIGRNDATNLSPAENGELEVFVRSEVEGRNRLYKKYCSTVDGVDGASAICAIVGLVMGIGGATLLANGVDLLPTWVLRVSLY